MKASRYLSEAERAALRELTDALKNLRMRRTARARKETQAARTKARQRVHVALDALRALLDVAYPGPIGESPLAVVSSGRALQLQEVVPVVVVRFGKAAWHFAPGWAAGAPLATPLPLLAEAATPDGGQARLALLSALRMTTTPPDQGGRVTGPGACPHCLEPLGSPHAAPCTSPRP